MAELLRHPLHIDYRNGRFGVTQQDSDVYKSDQLQATLRTNKGEHPLFYSFGIQDPRFRGFDKGDFLLTLSEYYSSDEISVQRISTVQTDTGIDIRIEYE